jgi:hypothetical protein
MDDESLKNHLAWAKKLYDSFQPVRDLITEHPELKEPIVEIIGKAMGKAMTQSFAGNFYAGKKP